MLIISKAKFSSGGPSKTSSSWGLKWQFRTLIHAHLVVLFFLGQWCIGCIQKLIRRLIGPGSGVPWLQIFFIHSLDCSWEQQLTRWFLHISMNSLTLRVWGWQGSMHTSKGIWKKNTNAFTFIYLIKGFILRLVNRRGLLYTDLYCHRWVFFGSFHFSHHLLGGLQFVGTQNYGKWFLGCGPWVQKKKDLLLLWWFALWVSKL